MERHKDYVLRAKDFHKKENQVRKLRMAASMRNPDEYDRSMAHARVRDGVHVSAPVVKASGKHKRAIARKENGEDLVHLQMARAHQLKVVERARASAALCVDQARRRVIFREQAPCIESVPSRVGGGGLSGLLGAERKLRELDEELSLVQVRRHVMSDSKTPRVRQSGKVDVFGDEDKHAVPVYKWMPQRKR
jgi:U3 small nucleolar RNA-associated protein 11